MTVTALLSIAITPKTQADSERLRHALGTLTAEDPTIRVNTNQATGEVVIGGMGELHLEVIVDRLKREFNVEATVSRLQIAYKETLTRRSDGEAKMRSRDQYAHVKIHLYPGEPGSSYVFENEIVGGAIPTKFIGSIDEGIQEALAHGVLAGYPVDDVRVVLYDGSYHEADSSEMAFKIAGSRVFADAAKRAQPVLLEPVMQVEIVAPEEHMDEIVADISSRRGQVLSHEDRDGRRIITALVPLSEMIGYATHLRSRTRGRGAFTMQFARYQPYDPLENADGDRDSLVGAPRKPMPPLRDSTVALPEPVDEDRDDL